VKLPDFGITEKLAGIVSGGKTTDLSNALTGKTQAYTPVPQIKGYATEADIVPYSNTPGTSKLGGAFSPTRTTGGSSNQAGNSVVTNDLLNNQLSNGNSQIDTDYNSYISDLNAQEQNLRGQADVYGQQLSNQAESAKTALGAEKTTKESGLATQEQTANKQASSALQQARDLYRQVQQRNIAQLSGVGLSSSSVAEALAERLGVETARRVAGVTGSQQEILQNIAKERSSLNDYYQRRLTDLDSELSTQKNALQQQLISGINQINNARNVAASERAQARQNLLSQTQSALAQLTANAQAFQQSLDQWKAQNETRLGQVGQDLPSLFQSLNNAVTNTANPQGLNYGFTINGNPQGQLGYQISASPKKNSLEDQMAQLYLQAGITQYP
jgi:hypothetical protein